MLSRFVRRNSCSDCPKEINSAVATRRMGGCKADGAHADGDQATLMCLSGERHQRQARPCRWVEVEERSLGPRAPFVLGRWVVLLFFSKA